MKKLVSLVTLCVLSLSLVACVEPEEMTLELDASLIDGIEMLQGDTISLADDTITTNDEAGVTFSVSDETVVTVTSEGTLEAVGAGYTSVTVSLASDPDTTASFGVTVVPIVITTDVLDLVMVATETHQLDVTTNDKVGVTYDTGDPLIATVSEDGLITAIAEGSTTITVTSNTIDDIVETITITVSDLSIDSDTSTVTLTEGDSETLVITTNDEQGVTFEIGDDTIAEINSEGVINALSEGTTTIIVRSVSDPSISKTIALTVDKRIIITLALDEIMLVQTETHLVDVSANDDLVFETSDDTVFTVDTNGTILAKNPGEATLTVRSVTDGTIFETMTVFVSKLIELTVAHNAYELIVDEVTSILYTANDEVTFLSSEPNVVSVDETGQMTANQFGFATIYITSVTDPTKVEEIDITVFKMTEEISITGDDILIVGMTSNLEINASPIGAYNGVEWTSLDPTIVSIDTDGIMTANAVGIVTIEAVSTLDDTIVDTFTVEVINVIAVDSTSTTGDTYDYMGVALPFGTKLFTTIQQAVDAATEDTLIVIAAGSYDEDVLLNQHGLMLQGVIGTIITGTITVAADNIIMEDLIFAGDSSITNTTAISNLTIRNINVDALTRTTGSFIELTKTTDLLITNSEFSNSNLTMISVTDFYGGEISIMHNKFFAVGDAIVIDAVSEYDSASSIQIWWNEMDEVDTAYTIDLLYGTEQKDIDVIVRFNKVFHQQHSVEASVGNTIDFTLNHWEMADLDMTSFTNVDPYYLRGFYVDSNEIPTEQEYNPDLPVLIFIDNPINTIMIGETHTFTYSILPMELADHPVRFITGNPDLLAINILGQITPLSSGEVYIQVRSAITSSIRTQDDFTIVTTPGIELTPDQVYAGISVGDTLTLTASPFPINYASEAVSFSSSDEGIATIDSSGVVTTLSEGLVTFTAALVSDPSVTQTFTIEVFDNLDPTNIMDYLIMNQITYSTPHEWIAYGFAYNYNDKRYESVSRYYFDNIIINDSKMVPVFNGIRPGEPMDPIPAGNTIYNDDNVYWVVVHDTASTGTGSGALAHANYLYNAAMAGNKLWVSWHFTIDDTYVYQHLPTNERGYHAGDGSCQVNVPCYSGDKYLGIGGGNRNGIGIEMAVNDDGDMMRTWQRTAKLVTDLLLEYNLPLSNAKYHNDFSGKDCPNTLRNAGLLPLFEEFKEVEYTMATSFPGAQITMTSNDPEYLDDHGRVISMPDRAMTVSYTITVTYDGVTESQTFYTYLPGTVR